jgi:2,3-bisphosphoglycerate-dependent phosphoglycerate mutase
VAGPASEVQGGVVTERRLYLIRHAKADRRSSAEAATPRGVAADPPLDETGREQAGILAMRLAKMHAPAAILCSTLTRARETIAPFLERTGGTGPGAVGATSPEITYRDDLAEWFGGDWEFKEFEELVVEHPEIPQRVLLQDPLFHLAPGGEPFEAFQSRVVGAIEEGLEKHPEGDVWVVCHGGVINAYVESILGMEGQEMFFLPPNTSINTVKVEGDRRFLWFLADDTHITEPSLFPD